MHSMWTSLEDRSRRNKEINPRTMTLGKDRKEVAKKDKTEQKGRAKEEAVEILEATELVEGGGEEGEGW